MLTMCTITVVDIVVIRYEYITLLLPVICILEICTYSLLAEAVGTYTLRSVRPCAVAE